MPRARKAFRWPAMGIDFFFNGLKKIKNRKHIFLKTISPEKLRLFGSSLLHCFDKRLFKSQSQ